MANQVLTGFRPKGAKDEGQNTLQRLQMSSTASTAAVYQGDPLLWVSDGGVAVGASTDIHYSVMWGGASYVDGDGFRRGNNYYVAAAATVVPAIDAELGNYVYAVENFAKTRFEVPMTSTVTSILQTRMYDNADGIAGTGSTATGYSGWTLSGTAGTTATLGWRIVDFILAADNDYTTTSARLLVECNRTGDAGAAISADVTTSI